MHREISHSHTAFYQKSNLSLYLLTGFLAVLIGLDLWPALAAWDLLRGLELPTWPREWHGYRIALIAALIGGVRTLYGSLDSLLEGRIGADLAVAIACIAAILVGEPLVAAEIVFIGMVGECLESLTFERTQRAIRQIVEVCPRRCWLLRDGHEIRVFTREVQPGDHVVVKPGGRIPIDGVVIEGRSALDVSALTGETIPVDKGPEDEVLAGSLNQWGALTIEAKRVAEKTVVGQVIELTSRALQDKAPLERTADRLARFFLPAVLCLALLTFLAAFLYHSLLGPRLADGLRLGFGEATRLSVYPMLSVLVVACPCALILATPAAIIAALGRLAGTGVLIKGGSSLERLAEVSAIAFDKTGTLTEGRLELGEVGSLDGFTADEVLRVAATAEQRSEHPLAKLLLEEAQARKWTLEPLDDFQAHPGAGITAKTAGRTLVIGTRRLLEEQGLTLSPQALALLQVMDATGQTALLVARDGTVWGVVGARDRIRPEAASVIAALRDLGINDLALLTGDRTATADAVAERLGITEVHAELLPHQKADWIAHWQSRPLASKEDKTWTRLAPSARARVAMMGDGINDAPALARADVGLAIGGTGTDVAAEAGDIVFMGDPLQPLPLLLRLSRETVRIIWQNIVIFAFGVNAFGILLTAWLWPLLTPATWYEQGPVAAVVYHQLGSLAVLLNAMRLLWFDRTSIHPTWLRWRKTLTGANHWLERYLDLDEWLHSLSHHVRTSLAIAGIALMGIYFLSGLTQIESDEIAVVRRFGRILENDLLPGLHWRWPWPIEDVTRVRPDHIRVVPIGFRLQSGTDAIPAASTWSSSHGGDGLQRMPEEAVMITGDGNLIELQASIRYSIRNPRLYLFGVRAPDEILRSTAEAVLRETVAGRPFHDVLTANRARFGEEVLTRLKERCPEEGMHSLGIRLDGLSLHELHPPWEVVDAYHEVTQAMEARDRIVNEAQARALRDERDAQPRALQTVRFAEAYRTETVRQAEAARAVFLARCRARQKLSLEQECRLIGDVFAVMHSGQTPVAAYAIYEYHRREQLARQAALADFRLFWTALGDALSKRDKMIIDTDKLPGRRQLFLLDPEQFRVPALAPRGPRGATRGKEP